MKPRRRSLALLEGAIDLHVHASPSARPRVGDAWDVATEAARWGMAGVLIKDHDRATVADAALVNAHANSTKIFASVCCNAAVGGLNPRAATTAIQMGAAMVFLPTTSAGNDHRFWRAAGQSIAGDEEHDEPDLCVLSGAPADLAPEVLAILTACAASGVPVATGHLGIDEIDAVVTAAGSLGAQVVVTHAPVFTGADDDVLRRWADAGATLELAAVFCCGGAHMPSAVARDANADAAIIEAVGPRSVVLSSDLGLALAPPPTEGLAAYIEELLALGVRDTDIRMMTADNPRRLLAARR